LPTLGLKRIDPRAQFAKQVVEAQLGWARLLDPEVDRPYQVADGKEVLAPPLRFALSSSALSSFALSLAYASGDAPLRNPMTGIAARWKRPPLSGVKRTSNTQIEFFCF
jgi:hypothetical protein